MRDGFSLQHCTLESFFFEEIEHVQERRGTPLPRDVEAYVVGLLSRYAKRTQAAGRKSPALALQYLQAKSASGSARAHALRGVGDRALYISGVVPRSLDRTPVNVRYVKSIGESAYREVADGGALDVLAHVAELFDDVADVIGDVVELGGAGKQDLLTVYERWRRYGHRRDAQALIDAGVLIETEGTDNLQ
jgi:hypothetical protein